MNTDSAYVSLAIGDLEVTYEYVWRSVWVIGKCYAIYI